MSITKAIRDYLFTCPYLNQEKINVDYLGNDANEYSIEKISCEPIIKQYIDGSTIRQYQFALNSIRTYGNNYDTNMENNDFYELFEQWITIQNDLNNFPDIEGVYAIEVIHDSSLITKETDIAKYQIQLRVLYRRN